LERELVREGLADSAVLSRVEAQIQTAYQMGISGVPFFVLNDKYAFSGAQPPESILEILNQVANMPE
jgi:predicted DsbA family dithiol-disulfide isomerase